MNRRQAIGRLAALLGAGVVTPLVPASASASEHLAKAKARKALAEFKRGYSEGIINIYINPLNPSNPAMQRAVRQSLDFAN